MMPPQLGLEQKALYITPYKEQATRAEEAFKSVGLDMTVGTVDASQGKQAPVVVFDLCTAKETVFWKTPTMARRFNVALTRATHHVVIIAPEQLVLPLQGGQPRAIGRWIPECPVRHPQPGCETAWPYHNLWG